MSLTAIRRSTSHLAVLALGAVVALSASPEGTVEAAEPAQVSGSTEPSLRETVLALDAELFDAFNACDLDAWRALLAEDVEFYQDNSPPTTTRDALEVSFLDRCAQAERGTVLRRELVEESVEVHPIRDVGAVQIGTHRFFLAEGDAPEVQVAEPRFVHLWRFDGERWQITRVISYAH